jgi:V8-like Glu-specific endopeptidase
MDLHELYRALWPQVGLIASYFPGLQGNDPPYATGTATLIHPGAILTAAHVVYDDRYGGKSRGFDVTFGNNAYVHGIPGENARFREDLFPGWPPDRLCPFDLSVVRLGVEMGGINPATVNASTTADLAGYLTNVVGYPAEGYDVYGQPLFGRLFGAEAIARIDPGYDTGFSIQYPIATLGGMSGGPVYRSDEAQAGLALRAIHNNQLGNGDGDGLVLSAELVEQIRVWVRGP